MNIKRIVYAKTVLPCDQAIEGGKSDENVPIVFSFFAVTTENKVILVDAGCTFMPGFVLTEFVMPDKALANAGIAPSEVTDVVITHAHHDHIEGVRLFSEATVYIQEDEYASGSEYLDGRNVTLFGEKLEIAEGICAVRVGGHSKGSSIVEVNDGDKVIVLCGDECYLRESLEKSVPSGSIYSRENCMAFLKKYSVKPYVCLLTHVTEGDEVYFNGN